MIKLRSQYSSLTKARVDLAACCVFEDPPFLKQQIGSLTSAIRGIEPQIGTSHFMGKEHETLLLYPEGISADRLVLIGLGKSAKLSLEGLRRASATGAKLAHDLRARSLALMEPDPAIVEDGNLGRRSWKAIGQAMAEGAALSLYRFDKYVSKKAEDREQLDRILLVSGSPQRADSMKAGLHAARIVCDATYLARDLSNAPGNEIFPESLAEQAVRTGRRHGIRVRVFNERGIKKLGMGGLTAVAQGSDKPPRFIVMEYNPGKRHLSTVVLVGKGVTFDSGGISIKPSANMAEMKMDMAGAAAVIGTMEAAARLKLPLHLVGLIPAAENLPGGSSLKPGDILRHYNGRTSEIDNTDAEGRLILADALAYAAEFKPDAVIDLATLTGAVVVALGHVATGMMGNDQRIMDDLKESGEETYERVWQLPLFEEYEKLIKSDVADVKNTGGRWAGAMTAALFLKKFIGSYRWVHLDIAGTAILEDSQDYVPKGGSGVGVRLLTHFLQRWTEASHD